MSTQAPTDHTTEKRKDACNEWSKLCYSWWDKRADHAYFSLLKPVDSRPTVGRPVGKKVDADVENKESSPTWGWIRCFGPRITTPNPAKKAGLILPINSAMKAMTGLFYSWDGTKGFWRNPTDDGRPTLHRSTSVDSRLTVGEESTDSRSTFASETYSPQASPWCTWDRHCPARPLSSWSLPDSSTTVQGYFQRWGQASGVRVQYRYDEGKLWILVFSVRQWF